MHVPLLNFFMRSTCTVNIEQEEKKAFHDFQHFNSDNYNFTGGWSLQFFAYWYCSLIHTFRSELIWAFEAGAEY